MLMNGAARRQRPLARNVKITETSTVIPAMSGPAEAEAPAGRSWRVSKAIGKTLTAISIVTVPETVGVMIRRSVGSHQASATRTRLQTIIRLANVAGPAAEIVATMIAMNMAAGQVSAMCPAPNRHSWNACNEVIAAQINIAAKTLQVK